MSAQVFESSTLTAQHRCDRCGAQAYLQAEVGYVKEVEPGRLVHVKTSLLFCAHHATEHYEKLKHAPTVTRIDDNRKRLSATGK